MAVASLGYTPAMLFVSSWAPPALILQTYILHIYYPCLRNTTQIKVGIRLTTCNQVNLNTTNHTELRMG